jgi:RNA polymerase sigma-70 factor (ECF subfamily)
VDPTVFERQRPRLFGIAYRMLSSVQDAEDIVQDAYVRWQQADPLALRAPEGWLVAVTTRLAIDRLRRALTERQSYVGEWLPEPLVTAPGPTAEHASERASDLSVAFLLLLERLGPEERAAFLLRDVFDRGYDEIGDVVGRSAAAVRQMVHRARERVRDGERRAPVAPGEKVALWRRFVEALRADDEQALLGLMAPQVRMISDGGGKVAAARRSVEGARRVVAYVRGVQRRWQSYTDSRIDRLNGEPALITWREGRVYSMTWIDVEDGRITGFFRVLNPDKLRHASAAVGVR